MTTRHCDIVVAGGGPAGLAAALSFAARGYDVTLLERASERVLEQPDFDGREIALTHHSINWLERFGVWARIPVADRSPLKTARIETGAGGSNPLLFATPDRSGEGVDALGVLVPNHLIRAALYQAVCAQARITVLTERTITTCRSGKQFASVTCDDGTVVTCRLLVVADGRFSAVREMLGIGAIVHDFERSILVCRLRHAEPHGQVALQWFDEGQTVALLPVADDDVAREGGGHRSSLVLTVEAEEAARLQRLEPTAFETDVTERLKGRLSAVQLLSQRRIYPLKTVFAHRFQTDRVALVGDAAVGMHPITAHGFNLGIKGQDILTRMIVNGSGDPGDPAALRRFERRFRQETVPLFAATNGIASVYTRDIGPVLALRRTGLRIADGLSPFKRFVTGLLMDRSALR